MTARRFRRSRRASVGVAPEELARAAEVFGVGIDYFTDAFRLDGEGEFSFRVAEVEPAELEGFADQAGRWVATYRELSAQEGHRPSHLSLKLELTVASPFEKAWAAAEELRAAWRLGDVPANELHGVIEREIGALVLHVDAPRGISGAASRLPGLNAILVNRQEPVGRRNFDLVHELFHILTWEAMKPPQVEPLEPKPVKGNRVEHLAENFAAAILNANAGRGGALARSGEQGGPRMAQRERDPFSGERAGVEMATAQPRAPRPLRAVPHRRYPARRERRHPRQ